MKKVLILTYFSIIACKTFAATYIPYPNVSLQVLNKITTHSAIINIATNQPIIVDHKIIIFLERCYIPDRQDVSKSFALLKIIQIKQYKEHNIETEIFHGWMFAQHPAISNLENPLYDVHVLYCHTPENSKTIK